MWNEFKNFVKEHKILAIINAILICLFIWFFVSWFDITETNKLNGDVCHSWNMFKIFFN